MGNPTENRPMRTAEDVLSRAYDVRINSIQFHLATTTSTSTSTTTSTTTTAT